MLGGLRILVRAENLAFIWECSTSLVSQEQAASPTSPIPGH